jgi:hypothetical protein
LFDVVSPALVLKLALIASNLSGYPMPETPIPVIHLLSTADFDKKFCPKNPSDCYDLLGYYRDDDEIWVDSQQSDDWVYRAGQNSVFIHELVHWLQDHNGMNDLSCVTKRVREYEAYTVQNRYIVEYEHLDVEAHIPPTPCGQPAGGPQ